MFRTLVYKELRGIITGPKFTATLAACSLLLLISVYIGIGEYRQALAQYHHSQQLAEESIRQASGWRRVESREQRLPDAMQVFCSGLQYDIGRWSAVKEDETINLKHSGYSDDPIFAVFRMLDFTVIVQIVFSLFAILFTFDAVNGEKETGTLRLVFANAVPRGLYITAKFLGAWIGLTVPLLVPILLSLLMVQGFGIALSPDQWLRTLGLIGVSLVYVSLFAALGLLMSTLARRSSVSFLLSLVLWIALVLIIPRAGIMTAGHLAPVPRLAQIEGQRDAFATQQWERYYADANQRLLDQHQDQEEDSLDEAAIWTGLVREDSLRTEVQRSIEEHEMRLREDLRNRREKQQRVGLTLARISPAAVYQLAAMTLAGTDLSLKARYEAALADYRDQFLHYVKGKAADAGPGAGAVMIQIDSEKGMQITAGRSDGIDASDRPRFSAPQYRVADAAGSLVLDTALLLLFGLVAFGAAFVSFLRFDVR